MGGMADDPQDQLDPKPHLSLVQSPRGIEIVDEAIDSWIVRLEPLPDNFVVFDAPASLAAVTTVASFAQQLPELWEVINDQRNLRVVFSPEARRALLAGQYRLMRSGSDALPMAVDAAGRVAEVARVAPGVATGAGGTIAVGAAFSVAWPLALAAGMGAAAAIAEQRWLENTLAGLQDSVHRIEVRMRDDDLGTLEAADRLVAAVALRDGEAIPPMLASELAHAHHSVEAVYWSRRRFVERFKRDLEAEQTKHEAKTGTVAAWAGSVTSDLAGGSNGTIDELVVFVAAMISRARTTAAMSGVLASDGYGLAALRLIDSAQETLRDDYNDLHRRLAALARQDPSVPKWKQLLPGSADDVTRGAGLVRRLVEQMNLTIGAAMPARDETLSLEMRAG